jgi:hypothetical protein
MCAALQGEHARYPRAPYEEQEGFFLRGSSISRITPEGKNAPF